MRRVFQHGARRMAVVAGLAAVVLGLIAYAVVQPRKALASGGLVVGFWLIGGALLEMGDRLKLFRAPAAESARRARGLPRGAWGTTLAHAGLGIFVLGASFETAWRVEAAQALSLHGSQPLGAYTLTLTKVGTVEGPNYLAERGVVVETLAEMVSRGTALPAVEPVVSADPDPLLVLIYTSGSTGTPKGAMYPERLVANAWRTGLTHQQPDLPSIILSFLPMSHMMGRGTVYRTLAHGGTVYFAAKSDLSTLLEDIALVRPTQMTFVPRVWEMIHQEVQSEVDRRALDGVTEQQVLDERRVSLIGGRQLVAITGSAPISPELKAWVQKFLGLELTEAFGSTEAGGVMLGSYKPGAQWCREPGTAGGYVVTADPDALYRRVVDRGAEVVRPLAGTDYGANEFAVRDPEGNLWSFGDYSGEPSSP